MDERRKSVDLLFYEDAADATVSIERGPSQFAQMITLRINGKGDASQWKICPRKCCWRQLPLMAKPTAKDSSAFGVGSGVTAGSTLGYPIDHLTMRTIANSVACGQFFDHGITAYDE